MVTELTRAPNLTALYGKAALAGLRPGRRGGELPAGGLALSGVRVDVDHLAAYDRVCGFRLGNTLPPTYPHVLAFGAQLALMTADGFPFPLIGLVHVADTITVHRPVSADEPLVLTTHARNLRPHERGSQFDVVGEAAVDGVPVWRETSTYLRRNGNRTGRSTQDSAVPVADAVWRVPSDIGRCYAAVSGDRNPIHLHPLTARLFGFRAAIAHGMWSLARCLAHYEGTLPAAYTVAARFRAPITLPATVALTATSAGFDLRAARDGKPHVTATISPA